MDEFAIRMMQGYQEKQFQSVLDSNLDLESEEEKKELEEKQESSKDMLEAVKKALEGKVGNVKPVSYTHLLRPLTHFICSSFISVF